MCKSHVTSNLILIEPRRRDVTFAGDPLPELKEGASRGSVDDTFCILRKANMTRQEQIGPGTVADVPVSHMAVGGG